MVQWKRGACLSSFAGSNNPSGRPTKDQRSVTFKHLRILMWIIQNIAHQSKRNIAHCPCLDSIVVVACAIFSSDGIFESCQKNVCFMEVLVRTFYFLVKRCLEVVQLVSDTGWEMVYTPLVAMFYWPINTVKTAYLDPREVFDRNLLSIKHEDFPYGIHQWYNRKDVGICRIQTYIPIPTPTLTN